jgi:hypothetical protein
MAIGKASDFVIYQEQFYGGMYEAINQNVNAFNAASLGCIRMVAKDLKGDYNKEAFIKDIANLITRRDTTIVTAATDLAMQHAEIIGVKINRKIGPVAQTIDAFRKLGVDSKEMSYKLGGMIGDRKMKDYANTAIGAVEAALEGVAALTTDQSAAANITHTHLVTALSLMGDAAASVKCWVMHSKPYFDLMKQAIADKVFEVAGVTIYAGTVATFGRPVIVIDAPQLLQAGAPNKYPTLGLVEDAVVLTESEQEDIVAQVVTGLENLVVRIQGEYAFNLNTKGFQWDVTNGGAGPTDAAVFTTTNWDKIAYDNKLCAGVRLLTQ